MLNDKRTIAPSLVSALLRPRMEVLQSASFVGLCIAALDLLFGFQEEFHYVWKQPLHWNITKSLYIISRYFAFSVQIANTIISSVLRSKLPTAPDKLCRLLLGYQSFVIQLMLGVVNAILMLRVYALYNCSRIIGTILGLLFACKIANAIFGMLFFLPAQKFTATCLLAEVQPLAIYCFMLPEIGLPIVIVGLTTGKKIFIERKLDGWYRIPFLSRLNREGWVMFFLTSSAVAMAAVFASRVEDIGKPTLSLFPLFVAFLSSAGCKLILNLRASTVIDETQQLDRHRGEAEGSAVLTTIYESAWDARTFTATVIMTEVEPGDYTT